MVGVLVALVIGGLAGMLAGKLMRGRGYGIIGDVILGVAGGLIGGWVMGLLFGYKPEGLIPQFVVALIASCLLVAIVHLIKGEPVRS
jgi:uncharacterized membrane protein YeaQ/YmgE (transglycosylase-associated protein family)